jgi:hypothetical protein
MDNVFCRTTVNYATGNPSGDLAPVEVAMHNGRIAMLPGWEGCGFQLVRHESAVKDWSDDDAIARVHYAELEALARELTGCDHATITSHIKRGPEYAALHEDLAPIEFVHSDFAAGYDDILRQMMRDSANQGDVQALLRNGLTAASIDDARRIVVLQFWRNLGPARMDLPIGFCDARSVDGAEAQAFTIHDYAGAGGPSFEALAIIPNDPDRHDWYAFPDLMPDEVIAFRTYDTARVATGELYFTPHAAFRDPSVERGKPARSSIELRATCLYS